MRKLLFVLLIICVAVLVAIRMDPDPEPETRAPTQAELLSALGNGDDYLLHKDVFDPTARTLIRGGTCTLSDFRKQGGWVRSPGKSGMYFVFCDGNLIKHRWYLNVATGVFSQ